MTFAQLPETARVPGMPQSAIDTGCVDFIHPRRDCQRAVASTAHPYRHADRVRAGALDGATAGVFHEAEDGEPLRRLFRRLGALHGVDFTLQAEHPAAQTRAAHGAPANRLISATMWSCSSTIQRKLRRCIGTSDSRDVLLPRSGLFPCAGRAGVPAPDCRAHRRRPIRIWSSRMRHGREVYSVALALLNSLGEPAPTAGIRSSAPMSVKPRSTRYRTGVFMDSIAEDVSPERLRRYFVKQNPHYVVSRTIRDLCVFARHDIARDPLHSRLDLVSCRRTCSSTSAPAAQSHVMQVFRYALRLNGYLLLGPSEKRLGLGDETLRAAGQTRAGCTPVRRVWPPAAVSICPLSGPALFRWGFLPR